ncbi:MAG: amidohydrolase family protein [Gammaproteobacteria bacterium]|nr:amidohydrolase family protein [Gammaproteobacteria bacterium]MCY4323547.1 amidohydrolase family protein [Gammaproteobacteria bacterium]
MTTLESMSLKPLTLRLLAVVAAGILATGCAFQAGDERLSASASCIDREARDHLPLVDAHVHFRPFGGPTLDFERMVEYLNHAGVRYATVFGIGQMLPLDSDCIYYLDCPGVPVTPTLKNDFVNAMDYIKTGPHPVHLAMSMTFADLANPDTVLEGIRVLDREFPGLFGWMGEVNLVKQALFGNHHAPVPIEKIAGWAPFMAVLRERGIPMAIHADLGNDLEPTKYHAWMDEVLKRYPDNKIVWMHLGLSRELTSIDADVHISVMRDWFEAYPNLMMDLSWRVVEESIFDTKEKRDRYLPFLHEYSDRLLPGSDFVAYDTSTRAQYAAELRATSGIFRDLDDEAFANIALGHNYLRLLDLDHQHPRLCAK